MNKLESYSSMVSDEYNFHNPEDMLKVLGPGCRNMTILEKEFEITMGQRGLSVFLKGSSNHVNASIKLMDQFAYASRNGRSFKDVDLIRGARILSENPDAELDTIFNDVVYVTAKRRLISPKGLQQKKYVDAIRNNDLTFSIGPAGTGKTYLAVAMAVSELTKKNYRRIILSRPAEEAGERLGFLPGDLAENINPYLRPLYDSLNDMLGFEKTQVMISQDQIEIAPLAFMRGRTLNDAFIILDEAQNTTPEQMKMFLTRLGFSSKAVVTGDISQIDLPGGTSSGLVEAKHILKKVDGISFVSFSEQDVVRHPLVQEIIKAYDSK